MNLAMLLEMAADELGERVAFGGLDDGISFEALRQMASASLPRATHCGTIALAAPNGPEVPVTLFSAVWSGLSYAPVNYRLPPSSLAQLVETLRPDVLVCAKTVGSSLDELGEGVASMRRPSSEQWLSERAGAEAHAGFAEHPQGPAVILFTSGTSAAPKAATLQHEHLLSYVWNTTEFASADADEAVLLAAPPFHVAGVVGVLTSCYAGRRVVPLPSFSATSWLKTVREESVTNAFVVPTMLSRIVAVMESDPEARVPSMRSLTYGGARLPLPVLERAMELLPDTGFVNAYGLTETSSTVSILGPDDHREAAASRDPRLRRRLESAGRPIP
ncbi:MAG: class I adenylate-forming enzyme family protein, partial [Acidimicrobiales bacterium]